MAAEADVYAVCESCGVIVADGAAHALWHARIADIVPLLVAAVTTLDPETGTPVPAVRPAAELTDVATASTLEAQAVTALKTDATFLALPSPTTAQAVAQVKALTQQTNALIRLAVRALS